MGMQILVAVDLGETMPTIIQYATALLGDREGSIDLLHVNARINAPTMGHPAAKEFFRNFTGSNAEEQEELDVVMRAFVPDHQWGEVLVRSGEPANEVIAQAQAKEYDLVVVGTTARTGLSAVLIGSVAERVVRNAPGPVLVVR